MTAQRCESCGRLEDDVLKVQRIYLLPSEDAHAPHTAQVAPAAVGSEDDLVASPGDIELWCASCRGTFPHTVVVADQ